MKFSNEEIRRQDRLLNEKEATNLLNNGEYGVLSMKCEHDGAYGVPINYVWDGKESIYVHCAPEGKKLGCIGLNEKVSFCIVGKTNVIANKFTTEYESIILTCIAETKLPVTLRMQALSLLIRKYSPEFKEEGMSYAQKSFNRTEVIRLKILNWSGKSKSLNKVII